MDAEMRFVMTRDMNADARRRIVGLGGGLRKVWMVFIATAVPGAGVLGAFVWSRSHSVYWVAGVVVGFAGLMAVALLRAHRTLQRAYLAAGDLFQESEVVYRITDEEFAFVLARATGQFPWRVFERFVRYPDLCLLFYDPRAAFVLPCAAEHKEVLACLEQKVRANGGAVLDMTPLTVAEGGNQA
jgi:hypothetical protein